MLLSPGSTNLVDTSDISVPRLDSIFMVEEQFLALKAKAALSFGSSVNNEAKKHPCA
jgi:hypothetical protein